MDIVAPGNEARPRRQRQLLRDANQRLIKVTCGWALNHVPTSLRERGSVSCTDLVPLSEAECISYGGDSLGRFDRSACRRRARLLLYREINENIFAATRSMVVEDDSSELWDFICECVADSCTAWVKLSRDEYSYTHAKPRRLVVAPRHADSMVEEIVSRGERYWVVERAAAAARDIVPNDSRPHRSGGSIASDGDAGSARLESP